MYLMINKIEFGNNGDKYKIHRKLLLQWNIDFIYIDYNDIWNIQLTLKIMFVSTKIQLKSRYTFKNWKHDNYEW